MPNMHPITPLKNMTWHCPQICRLSPKYVSNSCQVCHAKHNHLCGIPRVQAFAQLHLTVTQNSVSLGTHHSTATHQSTSPSTSFVGQQHRWARTLPQADATLDVCSLKVKYQLRLYKDITGTEAIPQLLLALVVHHTISGLISSTRKFNHRTPKTLRWNIKSAFTPTSLLGDPPYLAMWLSLETLPSPADR